MSGRFGVAAILCVMAFLAATASAQQQVNRKQTETLLADFPPAVYATTQVSPNARRVAYVRHDQGKQTVWLDGKPQEAHDKVAALSFSPDSRWLAYAACRDGKWRIVVNGNPQAEYEAVGTPLFSPDSLKLAYVAKRADGKRVVVMHGKPSEPYELISAGLLIFSPDSKQLVFGGVKDGRCYVVVDGRLHGPYDDLGTATGYQFSTDGKHLAYVILKDKKLCVVRDGQLGPPSDDVGDLVFSPDGGRMASAVKAGGKWQVSVDGHNQRPTTRSARARSSSVRTARGWRTGPDR